MFVVDYCVFCYRPGNSFKDILQEHNDQLEISHDVDCPHQLVTVRRRHLWEDLNKLLSKPYYRLELPVKVKI